MGLYFQSGIHGPERDVGRIRLIGGFEVCGRDDQSRGLGTLHDPIADSELTRRSEGELGSRAFEDRKEPSDLHDSEGRFRFQSRLLTAPSPFSLVGTNILTTLFTTLPIVDDIKSELEAVRKVKLVHAYTSYESIENIF